MRNHVCTHTCSLLFSLPLLSYHLHLQCKLKHNRPRDIGHIVITQGILRICTKYHSALLNYPRVLSVLRRIQRIRNLGSFAYIYIYI